MSGFIVKTPETPVKDSRDYGVSLVGATGMSWVTRLKEMIHPPK